MPAMPVDKDSRCSCSRQSSAPWPLMLQFQQLKLCSPTVLHVHCHIGWGPTVKEPTILKTTNGHSHHMHPPYPTFESQSLYTNWSWAALGCGQTLFPCQLRLRQLSQTHTIFPPDKLYFCITPHCSPFEIGGTCQVLLKRSKSTPTPTLRKWHSSTRFRNQHTHGDFDEQRDSHPNSWTHYHVSTNTATISAMLAACSILSGFLYLEGMFLSLINMG